MRKPVKSFHIAPRLVLRLVFWTSAVMLVLSCLTLLIRMSVVDIYRVQGMSMEPTLYSGDYILAKRVPLGNGLPMLRRVLKREETPGRGEIVILRAPSTSTTYMVKRVIGIPGDTLAMRRGRLHVNQQVLYEPYVSEQSYHLEGEPAPGSWHYSYVIPPNQGHRYQPTGSNWGPIMVPDSSIFVLGDRRDNSGDSRDFGFFGPDELIAKPLVALGQGGALREFVALPVFIPVNRGATPSQARYSGSAFESHSGLD